MKPLQPTRTVTDALTKGIKHFLFNASNETRVFQWFIIIPLKVGGTFPIVPSGREFEVEQK